MNTWIELAGWTLLHFLWQGAAAALAGAALLQVLRTASPHARYAVACITLGAMLTAPIATAALLYRGIDAPSTVVTLASPGAGDASSADPGGWPRIESAPPAAAPPRQPLVPPQWPQSDALLSVVVMIWLGGVVILLGRLGAGCWRVRTLYRHATVDRPSPWQETGERLARVLGIARAISIFDTALVETPTVIGWMRPVILLPAAALANLTPAQVEAILAHELAHVRRHDFAVNLLQTLAETLLFYHPGIWWISSRIRAEREHCCDDVAVDVCGDAVAYAAALTELAAFSLGRDRLVVAATSGSLLHRVRRLLTRPAHASPRSSIALSIAVAVGLVLVVGSLRVISVAQSSDSGPDTSDRGFGPADVNELLGFELLPGPVVRPTQDPRGSRSWAVTVRYEDGDMALLGFTARSLIRDAYGLTGIPVVAPAWVDLESLELTVPADVSLEELRSNPGVVSSALRRLLEEQFSLETHVESRVFPVYALVTANADGALGPGLRPSSAVCYDQETLDHGVRLPPGTPFCGFDDRFTVHRGLRMTMAQLAEALDGNGETGLRLNVVDRTGLDGIYDLEIRLGPAPLAVMATLWTPVRAVLWPFGIRTIHQALPEQLGLRLEESTAPFNVLVVDRINRPSA